MLYRGSVVYVDKDAKTMDMVGVDLSNPVFILEDTSASLGQANRLKRYYENSLIIINKAEERKEKKDEA